jgi:hypothetical protein
VLSYPLALRGYLVDANSDGAFRAAADDGQIDRVADPRHNDVVL